MSFCHQKLPWVANNQKRVLILQKSHVLVGYHSNKVYRVATKYQQKYLNLTTWTFHSTALRRSITSIYHCISKQHTLILTYGSHSRWSIPVAMVTMDSKIHEKSVKSMFFLPFDPPTNPPHNLELMKGAQNYSLACLITIFQAFLGPK